MSDSDYSNIDYNYKIDLFKDMSGWKKMCDSLTHIPPEKRESYLMNFINTICGQQI